MTEMYRAIPAPPGGKAARVVVSTLLLVLLGACASPPVPSSSAVAGSPPEESKGARLYREYCANCHRPLAKSAKQDRSPSRIHSAIRHFAPMRFLEVLSIEEIRSISEALASNQVAP